MRQTASSTGRQHPCWERLCLDPTQNSLILSVLSLSRFADSRRHLQCIVSVERQLTSYRCDDSEDTPVCRRQTRVEIHHASPYVCTQWTTTDPALTTAGLSRRCRWWTTQTMTWNVLPDRYDRIEPLQHDATQTELSLKRCSSSSWLTVSKAAVRSSRHKADIYPTSAASSRSLNTFVTAAKHFLF